MKFVALYRDVGSSCDGCSRSLGLYASFAEARAIVMNDIEHYRQLYCGIKHEVEDNGNLLSIRIGRDEWLCEWEVVGVQ